MAHKWAGWLHYPCRMGGPQRFSAGDRMRKGPQMDRVAALPLPPGRSRTLQHAGQTQKWPENGVGGYITPSALGIPNTVERWSKSPAAHYRAGWLHKPGCLGGPMGERNRKWPTNGPGVYVTHAAWRIKNASQWGDKIGTSPQLDRVAT